MNEPLHLVSTPPSSSFPPSCTSPSVLALDDNEEDSFIHEGFHLKQRELSAVQADGAGGEEGKREVVGGGMCEGWGGSRGDCRWFVGLSTGGQGCCSLSLCLATSYCKSI